MIRLLLFLIAGIAMTLYFADKIGGNRPAERQASGASKVAVQVSPSLETSAASTSPKSERTRVINIVAKQKSGSPTSVEMVPFMTPMIVGPDGKLQTEAAVVTVVKPTNMQPQTEPQDKVPQFAVLYVSAQRVNVRGGPSTDAPVVGSVEFAEAVQVLSDPTQPWVQIRIEGDGVEGFMASRFLTKTDPQG